MIKNINQIEVLPIKDLWSGKSQLLVTDVYTIEKKLSDKQVNKIISCLTNSISQIANLNKKNKFEKPFKWIIEIGLLPGVTDNVGNTARELIKDLLATSFSQNEGVYSSKRYYFFEKISYSQVLKRAQRLSNPLINRVIVKSYQAWKRERLIAAVPRVKLAHLPQVLHVDLNVDDQELINIGKKGIKNPNGSRRGPLALNLLSMKAIQQYFLSKSRHPTDIELEAIAQTWSEHCKHTIFNSPLDQLDHGLFKTYIKRATDQIIKRSKNKRQFCASVFTDNSGAIEFNEKNLITYKVETHNSPSALDPYGGAVTGIVGVNRDAIGFGMGAKPVINTYGFCFADPQLENELYRDKNSHEKLLSPLQIMNGVINGVNTGGNCSGISTPQGFIYFDDRYQGKPLVFVGTVGLIPKKINQKSSVVKKALPGDYIVMLGGRVGLDGVHGATFSSEAMDSGSPSTAVQIGDAITQKKLSDALIKEARDQGLYHSLTDNGAGGLSCSVAEMAKESGGAIVDLELVPLKYPGLDPWQIWVSESQERMTLSIPKNKWKKFSKLMNDRGVEATVIGKFTKSGHCIVRYKKKIVMDIEMDFLHDGVPEVHLKSKNKKVVINTNKIIQKRDLTKDLLQLVGRLNIAGYNFIPSQYDHEVQAGSVIKPIQGRGKVIADATITRPILTSSKGVALSQGIYPSYGEIDPYAMVACAVDTAVRNVISVGANPEKIAILDNFCWCSSDDPYRLGELKAAACACYDLALAYGTPYISGKDSMFNDFVGYNKKKILTKISIPPTVLISSVAIVDDVCQSQTIDFKNPGDLIYLLGDTSDELGGSEYSRMTGIKSLSVPKVDPLKNKKLYHKFYQLMQFGIFASVVSVGRGGVGVALSRSAIAGQLGVDVNFDPTLFFSESQGRIIVSIDQKNKNKFEKKMKGVSFSLLGQVKTYTDFIIRHKKSEVVATDIKKLTTAYRQTFNNF